VWAAAFDVVKFDAAVDWFKRRTPITDAEFSRNAEQARRQAFWIAGVTQADVIKDVHESLEKALADGVPFETWKKEIGPKLSKAWLGRGINEPARTETIFRNWSQAAYSRARWEQMNEPSVLKFRPFLMFDGVADSRQSKVCATCNGTVLPAGHPWWNTHRPPMHHRCRSGIRSLRKEAAEARGITQSPPPVPSQEGFGDGGEWRGPDRAKYLEGAKPPTRPTR
jgi:SPP1 gp7 family putative phage head morphogenesis protein